MTLDVRWISFYFVVLFVVRDNISVLVFFFFSVSLSSLRSRNVEEFCGGGYMFDLLAVETVSLHISFMW